MDWTEISEEYLKFIYEARSNLEIQKNYIPIL